jgi:hypothetical protein
MADQTQPRQAPEANAGSGDTTRTFPGRVGATGGRVGRPANPAAEVVRSGPGVPAPEAGDKASRAEQIWRGGLTPGPARRLKLRRLLGSALTVVLLAASGVVLYLRFHHTPPVQVTSVTIARRTTIACGVDVSGRIDTNGSAGTVSYQWLVQPGRRQPRPKTVAVTSGQHVAQVTLILPLTGHGRASELVTLQVLAPDPKAVSATVAVRC